MYRKSFTLFGPNDTTFFWGLSIFEEFRVLPPLNFFKKRKVLNYWFFLIGHTLSTIKRVQKMFHAFWTKGYDGFLGLSIFEEFRVLPPLNFFKKQKVLKYWFFFDRTHSVHHKTCTKKVSRFLDQRIRRFFEVYRFSKNFVYYPLWTFSKNAKFYTIDFFIGHSL